MSPLVYKRPLYQALLKRLREPGRSVVAIEVKSGRAPESLAGMEALTKEVRLKRKLLVGGDGISLEEFLLKPVEHWLS